MAFSNGCSVAYSRLLSGRPSHVLQAICQCNLSYFKVIQSISSQPSLSQHSKFLICIYIYIYIHTYVYIYIYTHMYMYIHIHTTTWPAVSRPSGNLLHVCLKQMLHILQTSKQTREPFTQSTVLLLLSVCLPLTIWPAVSRPSL